MKDLTDKIKLVSFNINEKKCAYYQLAYDPNKPYWPEDIDPIGMVYHEGKLTRYGIKFKSYFTERAYTKSLRKKYNHYSFCKNSIHKIDFEILEYVRISKNKANYPIFDITLTNLREHYVVLKGITVFVIDVIPLPAKGLPHHPLKFTCRYTTSFNASEGEYYNKIDGLKIEAGDTSNFDVAFKPDVYRMGTFSWLIKLGFDFGDTMVETDVFAIIM